MKRYRVTFRSRYYPMEGTSARLVYADSKKQIRDNWHSFMCTDEYKIIKIEEIK